MDNRQIIEWIFVGVLLASEEHRDRDKIEQAFVGDEQLAAARSICNGKLPGMLQLYKPDKSGENVRDAILRKLMESAIYGRLRLTFKRLAAGESIRLEDARVSEAIEYLERLVDRCEIAKD